MKVLCNYLGGSISYGLNTSSSDRDERYVFVNTEISKIIGLERHDHESKITDSEDKFGFELRHFLNLLKKGNTMGLEMLHNDQWITCSDEFKYIQSLKNQLIDSHKLYKCLHGYCQSERGLVLGERTGVLGGKRKLHLDTYGYSYKNAVQFLRLCLCGKIFFQEGYFPVNITKVDIDGLLFRIKAHPGNYTKNNIIYLMDEYEKNLDESYNSIKVEYKYNTDVANSICYDLYMSILYNTDALQHRLEKTKLQ
jgi:predicted nucleotidyltransferase